MDSIEVVNNHRLYSHLDDITGMWQCVISKALYPLILYLYHRYSSDYLIARKLSALLEELLSHLSSSSRCTFQNVYFWLGSGLPDVGGLP